jgi:hypothetical protein
VIEFGSSTASSISAEAYARVTAARERYLTDAITEGAEAAFDAAMDATRRELLKLLGLESENAEAVLAASGTDAQLLALFLVKRVFGTPLTSVIVGSDQTGSGIAQSARGRHFSGLTSGGVDVEKDAGIAGLEDGIETIDVPFSAAAGRLRSAQDMDEATLAAVESAVSRGRKVLLQIIEISKLGWRAPSDSCLDRILQRWPGQVQVVADFCQMRASRTRLRHCLGKGFLVLVTGSKFFTGPAFSGALLTPAGFGAGAGRTRQSVHNLSAYSTAFDWPRNWAEFRAHLPRKANFGQWLRWQAALEEMARYYAVPKSFRDHARGSLMNYIACKLAAMPELECLGNDHAALGGTIRAVVPRKGGRRLSLRQCEALYQAMRCDLGELADGSLHRRRAARAVCHIGQPVALPGEDGAALRISISARTIRSCWAEDADAASAKIQSFLVDIDMLFEKLRLAIGHIDILDMSST